MSYYVDNQGRIRKNFAPTRTIPVFADIDNHLDEHSENPVQNKVITKEINKIKGILGEVVIEADEITFPYLFKSALPHSVEDKKIVFNAGMDLKEIKGRSYVVNQHLAINQSPSNYYGMVANAQGNSVSFVGTSNFQSGDNNYYIGVQPRVNVVEGHKYLLISTSNIFCLFLYGSGTSSSVAKASVYTAPFSLQVDFTIKPIDSSYIASGTQINENFSVYFVDLTQWFGSNSVIPSDLLSNPNLFFSKYYFDSLGYEEGIIRSTEPTTITTRGFNQWDEQWKNGIYFEGVYSENNDYVCSENFIDVFPNTNYFYSIQGITTSKYLIVEEHDKNHNYLKRYFVEPNETFSTSDKCFYIRFYVNDGYGNTYNNDICINISNPSLNGTYKAYEEHCYPISVPFLQSAGNVQDTDKKVNVGSYGFNGAETWIWSNSGNGFWFTYVEEFANVVSGYWLVQYLISNGLIVRLIKEDHSIRVYVDDNPTITSDTNIASLFNGARINFSLETPIDQEAITLPEDIKIQDGGTIELGFYEDERTPCDMTLEIAVSRLEE